MDTVHADLPTASPSSAISRRAILARLGVGSALAALAIPGRTSAQSTPTPARETPNTFRLTGDDGVEIIHATTSMTGMPTLAYRSPAANVEYTGEEIREDAAPFGTLITVFIGSVEDGYREELTLVLPEVNLAGDNEPTPFSTIGIVTRHLTTIAGPDTIEGAVQRYEVVPLEGTAEILWY